MDVVQGDIEWFWVAAVTAVLLIPTTALGLVALTVARDFNQQHPRLRWTLMTGHLVGVVVLVYVGLTIAYTVGE